MQCYLLYAPECKLKEGEWATTHFYKTHNGSLLEFNSIPICRTCLNTYIGDFGLNEDRVINICRILDIPFIRSIYKNCKTFADYKKSITNTGKGMNFNDSAFEDEELDTFTEEDLAMMKLQWGEGYSTPEYLFLANEFNNMMNAYEVTDYIQESYFQEICITKLMIQRERKKASGGNTKDLIKQLNDLVTMANLKPSTNKTDGKTYGEKIRTIENTKPAIVENPALEDVDGFEYYKKYFNGHLRKVLEVDKNEANRLTQESDKSDKEELIEE